MKTSNVSRYNYAELRERATAADATQIDIDSLGRWFELYGNDDWNGECYDADGIRLYPIVDWDEDADQGEVVGYEVR